MSLSPHIVCFQCRGVGIPRDAPVCPKCGVHFASHRALARGSTIADRFDVDYVLGEGGFGITYRAIQRSLGRSVAIKEYFPAVAYRDANTGSLKTSIKEQDSMSFENGLRRFKREGRFLVDFEHRAIVRAIDLIEENGTAYLVMKLIEGQPLSALLERLAKQGGTLSAKRTQAIAEELVEALGQIHAKGYHHLDIKPDNIMLKKDDGRPVLIDFGAARQGVNVTSTQAYSEAYAPLEVSFGGKVGPGSDIYELGVVLFEMLLGKRPPTARERRYDEDFKGWVLPDLLDPWNTLLSEALKLSLDDRPNDIEVWWSTILSGSQRSQVSEQALQQPSEVEQPKARVRTEEHKPAIHGVEADSTVGRASKVPFRPVALFAAVGLAVVMCIGGYALINKMGALSPEYGTIEVISSPNAANIEYDGVELDAKTPYVIDQVEAGTLHSIRLSADNYTPQVRDNITTEPGQMTQVHIVLEPSLGTLILGSVPDGAEIFIDWRAMDVTPCIIKGLPRVDNAFFQVTAKKEGFQDATATLKWVPGETEIKHTFKLKNESLGSQDEVLDAGKGNTPEKKREESSRPSSQRHPTLIATEDDKAPTGVNVKKGINDPIDDMIDSLEGEKDEPVVKKALERGEIKRVVLGALGRVAACNANEESGVITVRFTIQPSGGVGSALVTGPFAGTPLGGCILRVVRGLRFPAFSGSPITVTFPFRL